MYHTKILSFSLLTILLLVVTGCTTQPTNNTNTNTANNKTNTDVISSTNENTNTTNGNGEVNLSTRAVAEVDTADWLTYINEEYGFSFKYPKEWEVKELDGTIIGLISPELKVELAKGPNSTILSDLMIVINQPLNKTPYIVGDFANSLKALEKDGNIKSLTFTDSDNRAKFIEHNDFADADQYSQYIKINDDTIITSAYSMNLDKTFIFEEILYSLHSN